MFGRVPVILARVLFGRQERPTSSEPPANETKVLGHPSSCLCGQYFQPTEDGVCYATAAVSAERRNGEYVWRVTGRDPEHPIYTYGLQKGDRISHLNQSHLPLDSETDFALSYRDAPYLIFEIERASEFCSLRAKRLETGEMKVDVADVFLKEVLDTPACHSSGLRTKPQLEGEEVVGMLVSGRDPRHPLSRLGIRDGDIVLSINGVSLDGPESLSQVYRIMRTSSTLQFEVIRDNRRQTITKTLFVD